MGLSDESQRPNCKDVIATTGATGAKESADVTFPEQQRFLNLWSYATCHQRAATVVATTSTTGLTQSVKSKMGVLLYYWDYAKCTWRAVRAAQFSYPSYVKLYPPPALTTHPVFVLLLPIFFMGQRTYPGFRVAQVSRLSVTTGFIRVKSQHYHQLWGGLNKSTTS
jgi:hypothetical protein